MRRLVLALGIAAFALGAAPDAASAAAPDPHAVSAYQGAWEYHWGDSPRDAGGQPIWATADSAAAGFRPFGGIGSPPERNGQRFLWLRTKLVGHEASDPALSLLGVDQIFEAYLDGAPVYRFGIFEGPGALRFQGYVAHDIPLGHGFEGKTLALRIYSEHINIGLFGKQRIGSREGLAVAALKDDLGKLGMGLILVAIGASVLALFLVRREDRSYLMYGGFALSMGLYFLSERPSRVLFFNAPLAWVHAELAFLFLMPVFLAGYFELLFGIGPYGVVRWMRRIHLAYAVIAFALATAGVVPLMATLLPFQILVLFEFPYWSIASIRASWKGTLDDRIFSAGFTVAALSGAFDILGAMGVLPRRDVTVSHLGNFIFVLAMGLILGRRFVAVHERLGQWSIILQRSLATARVLEPGQHARVALDDLIRLLGAQRALLFLCEEGTSKLELRHGREAGGSDAGAEVTYRADIVEQVGARRRPLFAQRDRAAGSVIAAPLIMQEQLVGVVYLESGPSRRRFREDDLDVLLGLGSQISTAIVSTRAVRLELQSALQRSRLEQQGALLDAAARMALGDLATPIAVGAESELSPLALALDEMRRDVQTKIRTLEDRNAEVGVLNDELRRKIEQRSVNLLAALLDSDEPRGPEAQLRPGEMLGERYRVKTFLGRGAMGIVYEVTRISDERRFAAKVLSFSANKPAVARFVREAQILARLAHPNLISIADVDVTPLGVLYLVMELAAGTTLVDSYQRYGDVLWALTVLRQIADALAAVHERGVVHRDLKPSNVLVEQHAADGLPLVKLADFGISILVESEAEPALSGARDDELRTRDDARRSHDDDALRTLALKKLSHGQRPDLTQTGVLVGTPIYMAPELSRGSRNAQPPSDVFSLGVIAFEILTGERPFDVPAVFLAVQGESIELPDGLRIRDDIDPVLVELFERCMSIEPARRPTARMIAATLADFGIATPVLIPPSR